MDYNPIGNFLDKFKNILFQKEEFKSIVVKTIQDEVSKDIKSESVKMKNGFLYVSCSPILKSEIMIHKKQILEKLRILLPSNNFLDIK